tara:strand:- start:666 stop:1328 length:663 start_codon:yes stop_codon:yes gene_type:complete
MSVVAAGIGAGLSVVGGIIGSSAARKEKRRAARRVRKLNAKLENLEENRQEIINPYDNVESLADNMSNPFTQLGVATQATAMQVEQTDIALANSLDQLRQTGGGAGGATALAQAALQSKKGVAADIESQEKANDDKRIQGEATLQRQQIAEEKRMQNVDVMGQKFVYSETEKREQQQLDRVSGQLAAAQGVRAEAQRDQTAAITGAIGSVASIAGGAFGK